jgi:TolA-binding protein
MNRSRSHAVFAALSLALVSGTVSLAQESPRARSLYTVGIQLQEEAESLKDQRLSRELMKRAAEVFEQVSALAAGPQADDALFRAARCFLDVGDDESTSKALRLLLTLSQMSPQSRLAPDAAYLRGEIYLSQNSWGRALKTWKELAESYPESSAAPKALFNCGKVFSEKVRNSDEAVKVYSVIVEKYPQAEVAAGSLFERAEIKAANRSHKDAAADYVMVANNYGKSELADKAMMKAIDIMDLSLRDYAEAHRLCLEFKKMFPHSTYVSRVERVEIKNQKYAHSQ